MKLPLALAAAATLAIASTPAWSQSQYPRPAGVGVDGLAPWSQPWEYDTGGGMDRNPERPAYQRGGGQQTGGPARNLIPSDNFHLFPR